MTLSYDTATEEQKGLFPECVFAETLWDIHGTWEDFKNFHGERCIEASGSISLVDVLVQSGLCSSKSDARRLIQQGGVSVWFQKVTEEDMILHPSAQEALGLCIVHKGKHGNRMTGDTAIVYWKDL